MERDDRTGGVDKEREHGQVVIRRQRGILLIPPAVDQLANRGGTTVLIASSPHRKQFSWVSRQAESDDAGSF